MGIKKESIPYLFQAFKRIDESENRYMREPDWDFDCEAVSRTYGR